MSMAAPIGPIDVEGVIRQVTWYPDRFIPAIPMMSGSLGTDRTIPAHYKLRLGEVEASNWAEYERLLHSVTVDRDRDDGFLKVGMRIRIYGLRMLGDEGGMVSYCDRVEIL